jgi:hypothetical protein
MLQAITTKYLGPTNHRGSRIKATSYRGSLTIPWDAALDTADNHTAAARAAAQKWGWTGLWTGGSLPRNTGYAFVCMGLSSGSFCIEGDR